MLKRLMSRPLLTQTQQKLLLPTLQPSHGFSEETQEHSGAVISLCTPTHSQNKISAAEGKQGLAEAGEIRCETSP